MAEWYREAVIYELHVRAFCDSNGDGTGDFDGLTSKLDHLVNLGVTALWLLPFYPSPLRDDGYDIADYTTVHPAYGTLGAFRRFLRAAHDRGLKVITELVINHTSDQHRWFQRARRAVDGSSARNFYVWSDTPDRYADARIIFGDFEHSNWAWDPVANAYYWHRFYSHQPDLNFANPAVQAAVIGVLDQWFALGVDGLRLDAVPYLFEREGTNCENLPETHEFLRKLRAHIDHRWDDRMLLAEANQWPEDAVAYFGDGDECHMSFHFPVMPRLFMGLRMEQRAPIVDIMEQTPAPPAGCQWATFLRNHDELTLEMVTDEERDYMVRAYAHDPQMRVNLGIRRRLAPLLDNDRRKIELLNALLFSLPGTPVVYYGDELGMGDNVYLGDRDGVRTPMQWNADRNAGFSAANPHRLYLPLITEPGYHYEYVNVEAQNADPSSLLRWMRQLIALHRRHPVLTQGDIKFLDIDNPHVLAFVRCSDTEPTLLVVANLSRLAQHAELDLREWVGHTPVEVFGLTRFAPVGELPYYLTLAPYGFFWLSLDAPVLPEGAGDDGLPEIDPARFARTGGRGDGGGGGGNGLARRSGAGNGARDPLADALRRWLPAQRWFSAKGRTIRDLRIDDSVTVATGAAADTSVLLVSIDYTEGEGQTYAIPLALARGASAGSLATLRPGAVVARAGDDALVVDAMAHQPSAAALVGTALSRRRPRGARGQLVGHPRPRSRGRPAIDPLAVHLIGGEQSNSSVVVDNEIIAKLVRRPEAGDHPDIEVPQHLRAQGFSHVPAVAASLEYEQAGRSPVTVLVAHEVVGNEGDLFTWLRHELARVLDEREHVDVAHPEELDADLSDRSFEIMELLGRRTAELHHALVGEGAFAPEPFTLLHQRSILQTLRSRWRTVRRELNRQAGASRRGGGGGPGDSDTAALVAEVLTRGDGLLSPFEPLRRRKLDAQRIRLHGDLHLGQVLWSGHDVVFIDFEGEPGRSLGERRIKRTPLVDVAGLLRSIDYAARMAVAASVERGRLEDPEAEAAARRWALGWRDDAQHRLVGAYRQAVDPALIPADGADGALLLDAMTLEKALYEVSYELANRPQWVGWPLAAVAERLGPGSGR